MCPASPGPDGRDNRRAHTVSDGPLVPDGDALACRRADARGIHSTVLRRRQDGATAISAPGGRRDLPPPGLLAKTVTTLDVLSRGRAELGLGAAWYEREHRGLGVPFPPLRERYERLEETLQICFQMWSDDNGPYTGTHYQLAETLCSPQPVSSPRPRVLVGGGGERKTRRLVAAYADACNIIGDVETVTHKVDVLRRQCDTIGRDFAEVEVTALTGWRTTPDQTPSCVKPRRFMARASRRSRSVRPVLSRRSGWNRYGGRSCRC